MESKENIYVDEHGNQWYEDKSCLECGHALEVEFPYECSLCGAAQVEEKRHVFPKEEGTENDGTTTWK